MVNVLEHVQNGIRILRNLFMLSNQVSFILIDNMTEYSTILMLLLIINIYRSDQGDSSSSMTGGGMTRGEAVI